ncbi:hypothetical protein DFAR_3970001 [Desulfarculales bacterium]
MSLYLHRATRVGLSWLFPTSLDETQLERLLFPFPTVPSTGFRPELDWSQVYHELRRKGMILALLWEEYKAIHTLGYQYS